MEFWGLKGDPFSNADEPVDYLQPSIESIIVETSAISQLQKILDNPSGIEQKKLFIIGERGSGKSQCLNYILFKTLQEINDRRIFPIYIPFTNLSVFNELKKELSADEYFQKTPELFKKLDLDFFEVTLKALTSDLIRFLDITNIKLSDFFPPEDFKKLTIAINEATDLFMGRGKYTGASKTPTNILASIQEIIRLMNKGFSKIVLIYDEIDKTENPEIVIRFLSNNRGNFSTFVNELNCLIIFSGRLEWKNLLSGSAFSDIFGEKIIIEPYDDDQVKALLMNRLIYQRCRKMPIDKSSNLTFIKNESKGNPRYIQWNFRNVMQQMARLGIKNIKDYDYKALNLNEITQLEEELKRNPDLKITYLKLERALKSDTPGYFFDIIRVAVEKNSIPIKASRIALKELGLDMTEPEYENYTRNLLAMDILQDRTEYFHIDKSVKIFYNALKKINKELDLVPRILLAIGPIERTGLVFNIKSYTLKVLKEKKSWLSVDKIIEIILQDAAVLEDAKRSLGEMTLALLSNRLKLGAKNYLDGLVNNQEVDVKEEEGKQLFIWRMYSLEQKLEQRQEYVKEIIKEKIPEPLIDYTLEKSGEKLQQIEKDIENKDPEKLLLHSKEFIEQDVEKGLMSILLNEQDIPKASAKEAILEFKDLFGGNISKIINTYDIKNERDSVNKSIFILEKLREIIIECGIGEEAEIITSTFLPEMNSLSILLEFTETNGYTMKEMFDDTISIKKIDEYLDRLSTFERKRAEYEEKKRITNNMELGAFGSSRFDIPIDKNDILFSKRIDTIMPTILQSYGVSTDGAPLHWSNNQDWLHIDYQHVIVFFIDGLGWINWEVIWKLEEAGVLKNYTAIPSNIKPLPLITTLPSHTACAEATIFTGLMPSLHGIVGRKFWYKPDNGPIDIFGEGEFQCKQWEPLRKKVQRTSLINQLKGQGISTLVCFEHIKTKYAMNVLGIDQKSLKQYDSLHDGVNFIADHIKNANHEKQRTFNFLAYSDYDTKAHETGPYSLESRTRLKEMLKVIDQFILDNKNDLTNTLLLIISDHGLTECRPKLENQVNLYQEDILKESLLCEPEKSILISGNRFAHIYLKKNIDNTKILEIVQQLSKKNPGLIIIPKDKIRSMGYCLDGDECGQIIVIAGPNQILKSPGTFSHIGFHGGTSIEEQLALVIGWKI